MPTNEAVVLTDPPTDKAFHEPILGDDVMPPEILAHIKAEALAAGIDPALLED